jgi:hypothetical protein
MRRRCSQLCGRAGSASHSRQDFIVHLPTFAILFGMRSRRTNRGASNSASGVGASIRPSDARNHGSLTLSSRYVNQHSKHCRICNRCVSDFDHHCIWLNICIARRTYSAFFLLLLSLVAACTAHGVSSGIRPHVPASTSRLLFYTPSNPTGFVLHRASQSLSHAWWPTTPTIAVFVVAATTLLLCVLVRARALCSAVLSLSHCGCNSLWRCRSWALCCISYSCTAS